MGEIRVKLYGALSLIGDKKDFKERLKNGVAVNINESANIRDVLKILNIPAKDVHIASIGKQRVMLDASLKDGDTLHLFPLMGGG